jgi:NADH dehydrogenase (ubiquinone) 1 alpha subcomplex subunit 13
VSNLPKQDMPPVGGFEHVRYKRNIPIRGPGGAAIFGGVAAVCAYGFYLVGQGNLEKRYVPSNPLGNVG